MTNYNANPLANDAIRDNYFGDYDEPDKYCLAPADDGSEDHYDYRVRIQILTPQAGDTSNVFAYISAVSSILQVKGWDLVPEVAADESSVTLVYTAADGWLVDDVLTTTQTIVDMAYGCRLQIIPEGQPVPPGHVYTPGVNTWNGQLA